MVLLDRDDELAQIAAIMRHEEHLTVEELLDEKLRRPAWHADAACRGRTGFFALGPVDALAICAGCPVRARCAWFGVEGEEVGVWGGTTERQRERARTEGWTLQQLLDSEPELDAPCAYCGGCTDTRGRCSVCDHGKKRAARRRAEAFRLEQERRRRRGERPLPPWGVESRGRR